MDAKTILGHKGHEVVTIKPEATIREAMGRLIGEKVGALVVVDSQETVVGIITERDIFRLSHRQEGKIMDNVVSEVMTRDVIIAVPDDDLEYLKSLITERRIRHLPVMDSGKLAGLISIGDVLRQQSDEAKVTVRLLHDYIQGTYPA